MVIASAGPTGLMLAAELALAGVDVAVLERRVSPEVDGVRAGGLHARTIEVLDQRGMAGRFLAEGQAVQIQRFGGVLLDISDFPARHPYGLALRQSRVERLLAGWAGELGVQVIRGCEVTGLAQDAAGVDVALSGGRSLRAGYLVGCDGGRSLIRKAAGIEFPGSDPTASWLIAEVEVDQEPETGLRPEGGGIGRMPDGGPVRVVLKEPDPDRSGDPTLDEVRQALIRAYGTDFGVRDPTWMSRFSDATRQAASYRAGRVLLAGDAAHVHPPQGGQGLNLGVQDAVNLGWKLAQVARGTSPDSLLDTYHAERHPVGARVLRTTMAQVALSQQDGGHQALRGIMAELLALDGPRRHLAGLMSGLDIRYDLGDGHPLLGRRMPDLDLVVTGRPLRMFRLLHAARPVLLNLGPPGALDRAPRPGRVSLVDASYAGPWELPVLGPVPAPAAVLIRPDGYVAWAGDLADPALRGALAAWAGPPGPA